MSLSVNRTEYFYSFNKLYTRYIVLIHKVAWNEENVEMKVCDKKKNEWQWISSNSLCF